MSHERAVRVSFLLFLICLGIASNRFLSFSAAQSVRVQTAYQINLDKQEKWYLRTVATVYRWVGGRFSKLQFTTSYDTGRIHSVSVSDADKSEVGYLGYEDTKEAFILNPSTEKRVAYSQEALGKIYSLFTFVASPERMLGDEHFVSFVYQDSDTAKITHYGILLLLKSEEVSPFPDVNTVVYGGRLLKAWRINLWVAKNDDEELTRRTFDTKGTLTIFCEGLVVREGELKGSVLSMHVRTIDSENEHMGHLVLKNLSASPIP